MPSLLATLGLDASSFQAKLTQSQKYASQVGKNMGASLMAPIKQALGAFAVGMVVRDAFGMADRIKDLSDQFRVSAETIQRWDIAGKRMGMTAEDMGNALNRLKKAREGAVASGNLGAFAAFQIPMEALRDASISTEDVLNRMVEVVGGGNITEEQDVAGMELMGKSGARLLGAFQELHNLGPVKLLSDEEVNKMEKAAQAFEEMKRTSASWVGKAWIAATAAPPALWQTVKDLWNYAHSGGKKAAVFGGPGSDPQGGFTVRTEGEKSKLYGPVSEGMSTAQVTEMKRVQLQIAEKIWQNSLKTMTVEEKRAELNKEIAEHERASEKAFEDAEWTKGYKEKLEAENLRGELLGLKAAAAGKAGRSDVNALQRIGAYTPGITGTDKAILNIDHNVRRIADRPPGAGEPGGF